MVDASLNTTPAVGLEWLSGDANLDGAVTGDDYTVIDANLGMGAGNPLASSNLISAASLTAVPEPSPGVAIIALLPLAKRRSRGPDSEEPPRLPPAIRIAEDLFQ